MSGRNILVDIREGRVISTERSSPPSSLSVGGIIIGNRNCVVQSDHGSVSTEVFSLQLNSTLVEYLDAQMNHRHLICIETGRKQTLNSTKQKELLFMSLGQT